MVMTMSTRIMSIDIVRGFAVMGILAMNIIAFAMPDLAYSTPLADKPSAGQTSYISWIFSFLFIDGKMRGLFSLLFGASMMLVINRAEAKGDSPAAVHYKRMVWLALFGLAHYFFIWHGDILFNYAIIGCIAYAFHRLEARALFAAGIIIYSFSFIIMTIGMGALLYMQYAASIANADPEMVRQFAEMMKDEDFDLSGAKSLQELRGSYGSILAARFNEFYVPLVGVLLGLLETLPLMLLGMALQKSGFISGDWPVQRYRKWALWLIVPGLIMHIALAWVMVRSGYAVLTGFNITLAWAMLPRLMLIIGYAILLIRCAQRFADSAFIARVAATGQTAFTNYIATSIIMTSIFYGYGLGLFGTVPRPYLWFFIFGMWAVMLLWSKAWLDHFHYGPLEWLWRSLARGERQRLRR